MRTIINDLPTAADALDFEPYASALVKIIASESTETPLTIGVFGQWGAGKTSLMRMCERKLDERTAPLTVWFNAWKYEREGAVWRAMLVAVLNGLREVTISGKKRSQDYEDLLDGIEATLFTPGTPDADLGTVVLPEGKAPRVTLNLTPALASALPDLTGALEAGDVPEALDAVRRAQRRLYRQHVADLDRFQTRLEEALNLAGRRLVLIVDDLDRCLPENAVEVLEAVKLYLDVPGVVVMLGLDQLVLARGIEIRYRELGLLDAGTSDERRKRFVIEGTNYLEKIIQLPFQIPDIDPYRMGDFVRGLADRWADGVPEVFARGLGENPRRVKRTVNSFLLLSALADERRQGQIQQILLAKLVALQHVAHDLYELLKVSPRYLVELETHFARQSERPDSEQAGVPSGDGAMAEPDVSPALRPYLVRRPVQRILTLFVTGDDQRDHARFSLLSTEQLRTYFTLTRQSEALSISSGDKTFIEPRTVPVPAGKFVMGTTDEQLAAFASEGQDEQWFAYESPQHSVELSAYRIGKYPVTNAEYRSFIDETSHPAPHDWDNGNYPEGLSDHPVVHVSWEDAVAYTDWLSKRTGKPYTLPTEAQWERAARGSEGHPFPWGDTFDASLCNSAESGRAGTTPVGTFSPTGDSPYGAADCAGNVSEWCLDWFSEDAYTDRTWMAAKDPKGPAEGLFRVQRGGSFNYGRLNVRTAVRHGDYPTERSENVGFRIALRD